MTHPTGDPLIGRTVAHYEIVSRLGGGGMGVVYRANDRKLGRTVAVKFLPPQWSHDEAAKQRFIREAQAASATHHPAICTIHDIETADDGQLFIVMAYYEGPTLKERLQHGPLPVDEALEIAMQLADGLAKAHAQGVVHRDIKPGNLILTEDGVRIVDFGLATFADALQLTTDGSTLGTAAYMSPEQSRGEEADARTDVWAAGVVLYEMLSGHVPFRGSHAEAIAYAVRNDQAPALRAIRPEIPEEVEQLVFRALHKEAAIRFQSGRELARALRQVRGLTVPQDLRTEVVPVVERLTPPRRSRLRVALLVAAAAGLTGAPWLLWPIELMTVAIAPSVNQTGFPQLDGLEFALQHELVTALGSAHVVRPVPSDRVREVLRPFRAKGERSSPEVLEALRRHTTARAVLIPVHLYRDGEWSARVEVWDPRSGTRTVLPATEPVTSAVNPETAYRLQVQLAGTVEAHFVRLGPLRGLIRHRVRRWVGAGKPPAARFRHVSAAVEFERGLEAHDQMEYADALRHFGDAATRDPGSALIQAWRSRTALLMRRDDDAREFGARAVSLAADDAWASDRLFIAAVAAEAGARRDEADAAYRSLVAQDEHDSVALLQRGGFLERTGRDRDAVETFVAALDLDQALARPDLELCRLFAPSRLNEPVRARLHAQSALKKYQAIGSLEGEAQVAMCLSDVLRVGSPAERSEASRQAERARSILESLGRSYQLPRALYYQALAAFWEDRFQDAVSLNELALKRAGDAGNLSLEPFVYQNLGASHSRLGNRRQYIAFSKLGAELFAARGENERAAILQTNVGAALIDFGDDPDEGYRLVQNALRVFQQAQSSDREVYALQVSAAYHRYAGRHPEAERLLAQALAASQRSGSTQDLWPIRMDQARSRFEMGDYAAARELIEDGLQNVSARNRLQGEIWLAQIESRLGDFDTARSRLHSVEERMGSDDDVTAVLLATARGELEYESGRPAAAQPHFHRAASAWTADLPHARSVEAYAYQGLLAAVSGDVRSGLVSVERSLAQALVMRRHSLIARCRLYLARIALVQRRPHEALQFLAEIPDDDASRSIGPELRAEVHDARSTALLAIGSPAAADRESQAARRAIESIQRALPEALRRGFSTRVDVRRILQ